MPFTCKSHSQFEVLGLRLLRTAPDYVRELTLSPQGEPARCTSALVSRMLGPPHLRRRDALDQAAQGPWWHEACTQDSPYWQAV